MDGVDRLTLPKRTCVLEVDVPKPETPAKSSNIPGIPQDWLPKWSLLPLDSKLPMIPGPKGTPILCTTKVGEKIHKSTSDLDFDLTDPNSHVISNNYKPLHDPHLKPHLNAAQMRRRLLEGGFITKDGRVLCTLKEFNEYRRYLRKINLSLLKKSETVEKKTSPRNVRSTFKVQETARQEKVKEIRKRLIEREENDKERFQKRIEYENQRHARLQNEQEARINRFEKRTKEQENKRNKILQKRQNEEHDRKIQLIKKWVTMSEKRADCVAERIQQILDEKSNQLADRWEQRKEEQLKKIAVENEKIKLAKEITTKRINERINKAKTSQERRIKKFAYLTEERKKRREQIETEYEQRFEEKMKQRRQKKTKKKSKRPVSRKMFSLKSQWNLEESLLNSINLDTKIGKSLSYLGLVDFKGAEFDRNSIEEIVSSQEKLSTRESQVDCMLGQFHGAKFSGDYQIEAKPEHTDLRKAFSYDVDLSEFKGASSIGSKTKTMQFIKNIQPKCSLSPNFKYGFDSKSSSEESTQEQKEEKEELIKQAAEQLVQLNLELSTKVLLPALTKSASQLANEQGGFQEINTVKQSCSEKGVRFNETPDIIHISSFESFDANDLTDDELSFYEDDIDKGSSGSLLMSKDSLELILGTGSSDDTEKEEASVQHLLSRVMDDLSSGKMSAVEVDKLTNFIRELTATRKEEDMNDKLIDYSAMANDVVNDTLRQIEKKLTSEGSNVGENEKSERPPTPVLANHSDTDQSLASFVIGKTMSLAAESLEHLMTPEGEELLAISKSCGSPKSTESDYVLEAMKSVVKAMRKEYPLIKSNVSTSDYVVGLLKQVLSEVNSQTSSATDQYVKSRVDKIKSQLESSSSSSVSYKSVTLSPVTSKTSDVTAYVKQALKQIANVIEKDFDIENKPNTAVSHMVEHLVRGTLKACLSDLKSGSMDKSVIKSLAIAIVRSYKEIIDDNVDQDGHIAPRHTQSLDRQTESPAFINSKATASSSASIALDNLIQGTLYKLLDEMDRSSLGDSEIIDYSAALNGKSISRPESPKKIHSDEVYMSPKGTYIGPRSTTSLEAEKQVRETFQKILTRKSFYNLTNFDNNIKSDFNREKLIEGVIDAIKFGTDQSSTKDGQVNNGVCNEPNATLLNDSHIHLGSQHDFHDDSSSENEDIVDGVGQHVEVHPVIGDTPVHVQHEVAEEALGLISVRHPSALHDGHDPIARFSYRNLMQPDISKVKSVRHDAAHSDDTICRRLLDSSHRSLDAKKRHSIAVDTLPISEEAEPSAVSSESSVEAELDEPDINETVISVEDLRDKDNSFENVREKNSTNSKPVKLNSSNENFKKSKTSNYSGIDPKTVAAYGITSAKDNLKLMSTPNMKKNSLSNSKINDTIKKSLTDGNVKIKSTSNSSMSKLNASKERNGKTNTSPSDNTQSSQSRKNSSDNQLSKISKTSENVDNFEEIEEEIVGRSKKKTASSKTSLSSTRSKNSTKSNESNQNLQTKHKISHSSVNLTPRPSSGFGGRSQTTLTPKRATSHVDENSGKSSSPEDSRIGSRATKSDIRPNSNADSDNSNTRASSCYLAKADTQTSEQLIYGKTSSAPGCVEDV